MKRIVSIIFMFFIVHSCIAQQKVRSVDPLVTLSENAIKACENNDRDKASQLFNLALEQYSSFSGTEAEELAFIKNISNAFLWINKGVIKEEWGDATLNRDLEILPDLFHLKNELESKSYTYSNFHLATICSVCNIYRNNDLDLNVIGFLNNELANIDWELNNNVVLRNTYMNLGVSYIKMGNYQLAKTIFSICKLLSESAHDNNSPFYVSCLYFLATAYDKCNEPLMARLNIETAIETIQDLGVNVKEGDAAMTIQMLNTYGQCCMSLQDYFKSYEIYSSIIERIQKLSKEISPELLATPYMNAAQLLAYTEDYDGAISMLRQVSPELLSKSLQSGYFGNLIVYDYFTKNKNIWADLINFNNITKDYVLSLYTQLSKRERETIWNNFSESLNFYNYLSLDNSNPNIVSLAYNNALFTKNMLLQSSQIEERIISQSKSTEVKEMVDCRNELKVKMQNAKSLSFEEFASINSNLVKIEKDIYKNIPDFQSQLEASFPTWENVQNRLSDDEVAIEFIESAKLQSLEKGTNHIGALLVGKNSSHPLFIELCSTKQLSSYLDKHFSSDMINELYSSSNSKNMLFELIWEPLLPYITNYRTVYYSNISCLNRINHSAIPYKNSTMGNCWNMYLVSTTGAIKTDSNNVYSSAVLFGGIDYGGEEDELRDYAQAYRTNHSNEQIDRGNDTRAGWKYLSGTKIEAQGIEQLMKKSKISCQMFTGLNANEEAIKSMDGKSPAILHIATHGFYLSQSGQSDQRNKIFSIGQTREDTSMKYSGLLFAGGNNTWKRGKGYEGIEDGILTAEEIAKLDLSKTNLVVLSACETALGDGNNIDGVFGLQRAFKKAGVQTIIMSLWKVDDIATKDLMLYFYQNIVKGSPKRESFNSAVEIVKNKYKSPEYWAGFVMLD